MSILAKFKGARTIVFNVAVAVAGVLAGDELVAAITALGVTTDQAVDALVLLWAAANGVLRMLTTTPIFRRR